MVIGRKTTGVIRGLPDTGTGSHSAAVIKLRRALITDSMTATTGVVLLAATNKTETEALTRAETSANRTAIRPVDLTKARRSILGRIKTRISIVAMATVQTAKTTTKETVTQTDSEAASQPIDEQLPDQRRAGRTATGFLITEDSERSTLVLTCTSERRRQQRV
jgi:hypothetical protein